MVDAPSTRSERSADATEAEMKLHLVDDSFDLEDMSALEPAQLLTSIFHPRATKRSVAAARTEYLNRRAQAKEALKPEGGDNKPASVLDCEALDVAGGLYYFSMDPYRRPASYFYAKSPSKRTSNNIISLAGFPSLPPLRKREDVDTSSLTEHSASTLVSPNKSYSDNQEMRPPLRPPATRPPPPSLKDNGSNSDRWAALARSNPSSTSQARRSISPSLSNKSLRSRSIRGRSPPPRRPSRHERLRSRSRSRSPRRYYSPPLHPDPALMRFAQKPPSPPPRHRARSPSPIRRRLPSPPPRRLPSPPRRRSPSPPPRPRSPTPSRIPTSNITSASGVDRIDRLKSLKLKDFDPYLDFDRRIRPSWCRKLYMSLRDLMLACAPETDLWSTLPAGTGIWDFSRGPTTIAREVTQYEVKRSMLSKIGEKGIEGLIDGDWGRWNAMQVATGFVYELEEGRASWRQLRWVLEDAPLVEYGIVKHFADLSRFRDGTLRSFQELHAYLSSIYAIKLQPRLHRALVLVDFLRDEPDRHRLRHFFFGPDGQSKGDVWTKYLDGEDEDLVERLEKEERVRMGGQPTTVTAEEEEEVATIGTEDVVLVQETARAGTEEMESSNGPQTTTTSITTMEGVEVEAATSGMGDGALMQEEEGDVVLQVGESVEGEKAGEDSAEDMEMSDDDSEGAKSGTGGEAATDAGGAKEG